MDGLILRSEKKHRIFIKWFTGLGSWRIKRRTTYTDTINVNVNMVKNEWRLIPPILAERASITITFAAYGKTKQSDNCQQILRVRR